MHKYKFIDRIINLLIVQNGYKSLPTPTVGENKNNKDSIDGIPLIRDLSTGKIRPSMHSGQAKDKLFEDNSKQTLMKRDFSKIGTIMVMKKKIRKILIMILHRVMMMILKYLILMRMMEMISNQEILYQILIQVLIQENQDMILMPKCKRFRFTRIETKSKTKT